MAPPAAEPKPSPSPSSSSGPAGAGGETMAGGDVLLVAVCGTKVPLSRSAAWMSKVILGMMNEGLPDISFPVKDADAAGLRLVAAYCEKHGPHYDPVASAAGLRDPFAAFPIDLRPAMEAIKPVSVPDPDPHGLKDWDDKFISDLPDNSTLYGIINAANLLDIEELLDLGCMTVADMMRGKTPDEIRLALDIENDYTPEQEAEVRRENAWAFED